MFAEGYPMRLKNVLVLHKVSAFEVYFKGREKSLNRSLEPLVRSKVVCFKKAHEEHQRSLEIVEKILRQYKITFTKSYRGGKIDFNNFDVVISVGGDGTFLEAARGIKRQLLLGINSNPHFSVGRLCGINIKDFGNVLKSIIADDFKLTPLERLRLEGDSLSCPRDFVNDILVCHQNPAMMCRYGLRIGSQEEEQRSSGLWVSTAAGSTGAIQSAGARILRLSDKKFQYMPRELYYGLNRRYVLKGGILKPEKFFKVTSLMRGGIIFIDGAHSSIPFEYGVTVRILPSPYPLRTIRL